MNILQNMQIFVRVIDAGSFTGAADSLEISAASASRAVMELEQHLRTRLLNRSTRRFSLTEAGIAYLDRCRHILAAIRKAEDEVALATSSPKGVLRVHSFASFGQHYIIPAIQEYRRQFPEVRIELQLSQNIPDLFDGTCDTSILAVSALPDSNMVMHRVGFTYSVLCASPTYLAERGVPLHPKDLKEHDCLTLNSPTFSHREWVLERHGETERIDIDGVLRVNIAESLAVAIRSGMGVGSLPVHAALEGLQNGSLVRVLPEYTLEGKDIFVLYPSRRFVDAKTRAWTQFMRTHLPAKLERDHASLNVEAMVHAAVRAPTANAPVEVLN